MTHYFKCAPKWLKHKNDLLNICILVKLIFVKHKFSDIIAEYTDTHTRTHL